MKAHDLKPEHAWDRVWTGANLLTLDDPHGFERTDVQDLLSAANLGGAQTQTPVQVDYQDDHGDWRSAVLFEVWFNTHRTHVGALIPRVKAVEVTGDMDGGPDVGPFTVEDA